MTKNDHILTPFEAMVLLQNACRKQLLKEEIDSQPPVRHSILFDGPLPVEPISVDALARTASERGLDGELARSVAEKYCKRREGRPSSPSRPGSTRICLRKTSDSLHVETPRAGTSGLVGLMLAIGTLILIAGIAALYGPDRNPVSGWVLSVFGAFLLGVAIVHTTTRTRIEVGLGNFVLSIIRGPIRRIWEAEIEKVEVSEVLPPSYVVAALPLDPWKFSERYCILTVRLGGKELRILEGCSAAEKRWVASELELWLDLVR